MASIRLAVASTVVLSHVQRLVPRRGACIGKRQWNSARASAATALALRDDHVGTGAHDGLALQNCDELVLPRTGPVVPGGDFGDTLSVDRAETIEGQSRAAEALIELIRTGWPAVNWAVSEKPDLFGMLPYGLGDIERYALLARWADVLGTELRSSSHSVDMWEGGSSDPEHTGGHPVTRTWESLDVDAVKDGVPVGLSETVPIGTSARAHVSRPQQAPTDLTRTAQLKAAKALAEVLRTDLPTAGWGLYTHNEEPSLFGTIRIQRAKASRADLAEWADFLETEVHYGRKKRDFGHYRWGEVTGHVLGVRIQVKTDVRAPLALTGYWRSTSSGWRSLKTSPSSARPSG